MKFSRASRIVAFCIALFSMLFMQLAVASYACPGMAAGSIDNASAMSASMDDGDMSGCDGMDAAQPSLCHAFAHGDTVKRALDNPQLPDIPPFVPVELMLTLQLVESVAPSIAPPLSSVLLTRMTAPPIAIRNCCYRI